MLAIDRQQAILDLLKNLKGLDPLKQLLWSQLNDKQVNPSLPRCAWTKTTDSVVADPVLFAVGGDEFHVICARLNYDCCDKLFDSVFTNQAVNLSAYCVVG